MEAETRKKLTVIKLNLPRYVFGKQVSALTSQLTAKPENTKGVLLKLCIDEDSNLKAQPQLSQAIYNI